MDNKECSFNHSIQLTDRKNLVISSVKKIINFDENEFFIESSLGELLIKGTSLELVKLDTFQGSLTIKGKVDSLIYFDNNKKISNKTSIMSRLFKW